MSEICILVEEFLLFWQNLKNEDSRAKKRFLEGSKKEVKKVINSKNDFSKSYPKFCKLGDGFFLFWRNLKNEAATAEKRSFDNVYNLHNKSCIFNPGASENQNYDEKYILELKRYENGYSM